MAERCVSQVVRQRQGFGQVFVQLESPGNRSRNLSGLEGVCQAGSVMVALVIDEDLSFVLETPKSGGVNDPIAIALKFRSQITRID